MTYFHPTLRCFGDIWNTYVTLFGNALCLNLQLLLFEIFVKLRREILIKTLNIFYIEDTSFRFMFVFLFEYTWIKSGKGCLSKLIPLLTYRLTTYHDLKIVIRCTIVVQHGIFYCSVHDLYFRIFITTTLLLQIFIFQTFVHIQTSNKLGMRATLSRVLFDVYYINLHFAFTLRKTRCA